MDVSSIIGALIIGAILGVIGRAIAPGRQNIPIWLTIAVGIVAAFIGTALARAFGVENTSGIDWIEVALQVGAAVVGVMGAATMWPRLKSSV